MTVNELLEKMRKQGQTEDDFRMVKKAYEFASQAHAGQKRKSGEPYFVHPLATAARLADLHMDTPTIAAALLHDICEDTDLTIGDIKKEFGEEIAFIVSGVTKLDKIRYRGTERTAESLRKMFLAIAQDLRIVLLKLVDRLHNMETLAYVAPEKRKRIALETLEIYAPLAYRLGIGELKGQLEDLSFPYVYPQEHEWIMRTLKDHFGPRRQYMERLQPVVAQELTKEKIKFYDIHARAKHYYSLYKKLIKYDMDIDRVFDLVALRIVVEGVEDCYAALGVVHKLWKPMPGLVKDYIAMPKPNGYRSLHTTVFGPEGRTIEFQIRTRKMHEEAENGIAAHWAYAERKGSLAYVKRESQFAPPKELFWIQQLREWQKEFENPDEFLESLKIDFFKNRIFVLTPKGDIIDLPEGATPVDFAYHVHSEIGNAASGAKVNGKMVPLDHLLKNGDLVEILTQKNKKPSRDWLGFMKSPHARKKVVAFLKKMWEEKIFEKPGGEMTELRLAVHERIGLLRDVSHVFARQKIHMKNVSMDTKHRSFPLIIIQSPFKNRQELEKIMVKLKEIKGVEEISYKLL